MTRENGSYDALIQLARDLRDCADRRYEIPNLGQALRVMSDDLVRYANSLFCQLQSAESALLPDVCRILGWQGGTRAQVLDEIAKLVARVKSLEAFKRSVDDALNSGNGSYRP